MDLLSSSLGSVQEALVGSSGSSGGLEDVDFPDEGPSNFSNCSNQYCVTDDEYVDMMWKYIFPTTIEWIFVFIYLVVFTVGLVGNFLVCVAVYRNTTMRTVTNYFIVNLAVADFMVICICLPPTIIWDVTNTWFLGKYLCKIVLYFQTVSVSVSVLTLTFISVERWYAICFPLKFKATTSRAKRAILAIWAISLSFALPELFTLDIDLTNTKLDTTLFTQCVPTWGPTLDMIYMIARIVLLYCLPLIFMSVAYYQIARVLWSSSNIPGERRYPTTNGNGSQVQYSSGRLLTPTHRGTSIHVSNAVDCQLRSRRKAAKMLVAVVIMFAFCYLPVHIYSVLTLLIDLYPNDLVSSMVLMTHWLPYANSAINPLIYNFMSEKFQKEFLRTFGCWMLGRRRNRRIPIRRRTPTANSFTGHSDVLTRTRNSTYSTRNYPGSTRTENLVMTTVKDAYRWLEDINSKETLQFIRDQNALTEDFLNEVEDRQVIEDTVKKTWYKPQFRNVPVKADGKYYYCQYSNTSEEQCTVYVQPGIQSQAKVFFDPMEVFKNKAGKVAVKNFGFSKDGKVFSYCFTQDNSEWETCQFKHTETGDDLPDRIEGLRFASLEWTHDNKGFFYAAYPIESDGRSRKFENQQGWYHTMGSPQTADILIMQFPESPSSKLAFKVSDCGKHLLAFPRMGPRANSVYISSLERGIFMFMIWKPIFGDIKEARYEYLTNNGSAFYFRTNRKASRFQVIQVETDRVKNPRSSFASVIPEDSANNLLIITRPLNQSKLLLVYSGHLTFRIELREFNDGKLLEVVNLNETAGTVVQVNENTTGESEFFLLYESVAVPGRVYHCTLEDVGINCKVFQNSQLPDSLHAASMEVNLINYPGADRIMLPMLLVHKKDMVKNESTPVVIQALTHVNKTMEHRFQIESLIFVNHFNGIWAIPLVRGNSQQSQQLPRIARQKAFEDFFAAIRYLIHEKYTQRSKVVITGHANSAILAAVCLNREPGDFSAAIFTGGVFDILRYHELGREFWSSVDFEQMQTKEDFSALLRFSPLHTIQKYLPSQIQYPSILVLNEAVDSQISPFHSYKFTAELQNRIGNLSQQTNPLLLKVETESLMEFNAKISSKVRQWSAAFSFMKRTTNLEFNSAPGHKNLVLLTVVLQYVLFYFS